MSDYQLVQAAQRGDDGAFRTLVERHQRKAFVVAAGILRDADAARDVCQDAFLKVHQRLATFEGGAQFYTWLYRIVVNLCIDQLRRRRLDGGDYEDWSEQAASPRSFDPAESLARKELSERLHDAFNRLSPTHRTVVTLRELNGLSYKEIAQVMRCSVGTVMSRLFNARRYLQEMLADVPDAELLAAA
jgi:RNA polymerase sigma-70 factor (ECF subfamily)